MSRSGRGIRRWIGWAAALGVVGCGGEEALGWRRSVELISLTDQARIVDLRAVEGNSGVERHQGVLRLDRWLAEGAPIQYARRSRAAQTRRGPGQIGVEDDLVQRTGEELVVALRSAELSARMVAREPQPRGAREAGGWRGRWSAVQLDGWMEAGTRGGRLHGPALLIEREGEAPRGPRRLLFLRGAGVEMGLDEQGGEREAWLLQGDQPLRRLDDLELRLDPWGQGSIRSASAGLRVELRLGPVRGSTALHDHLSAPEAALAAAWSGRSTRRATMVEARVRGLGAPSTPPAALSGEGPTPPDTFIHATGVFIDVGAAVGEASGEAGEAPARRLAWEREPDGSEAP